MDTQVHQALYLQTEGLSNLSSWYFKREIQKLIQNQETTLIGVRILVLIFLLFIFIITDKIYILAHFQNKISVIN